MLQVHTWDIGSPSYPILANDGFILIDALVVTSQGMRKQSSTSEKVRRREVVVEIDFY